MDETSTGGSAPEEKPVEVAPAAGPPPVEAPTVENPPAGSPPKKRNWTFIALIAVSCVALLLLGSTITLAVVGDFGCQKGGFRFERPDLRDMGPMRGPGDGRLPERPFRQWNNQDNQDNQDQQTTPPDKQKSETQPGQTAPETRTDPRPGQAS